MKKIAFLMKQASVVIESKTLPKYKDPSFPMVAYQIGNQDCSQALLDLGASKNLILALCLLATQSWRDQTHLCGTLIGGQIGKETKRNRRRCSTEN